MAVEIVGRVEPAYWYAYADGVFSFHVAKYADDSEIIFRVNNKTWPSEALSGALAKYTFMRNATPEEVDNWNKEQGFVGDNSPKRIEV